MSERLPPLTALRAFDAAARHMSFAEAAQELNVTPAALSFQIRNLEEHLGTPLFRRLNRAVELTAAGRALAPGCRDGFGQIGAAWRAAQRSMDAPVLTVTAGPAFTTQWLSPRLFDFARCHPEIELRFAATLRTLDFSRDEVDVALRYSVSADSTLWSMDLVDEWISPMMTPAMAERYDTPESLVHAPLFTDDSVAFLSPCPDWTAWFRASGLSQPPALAARFSQADHAIDAALAGGGIVLTRSSLAAPVLASGALVAPFDIALAGPARYRFLCRQDSTSLPQIAAFRDWLLQEIDTQTRCLPEKQIIQVSDLY